MGADSDPEPLLTNAWLTPMGEKPWGKHGDMRRVSQGDRCPLEIQRIDV